MSSQRKSSRDQGFPGPEDLDIVERLPAGDGSPLDGSVDPVPVETHRTRNGVQTNGHTGNAGKHPTRSAFSAVRQRIKDGKKPWGRPQDGLWLSHPTLAEWLMFRTLDGIRIREVSTMSISATPTGFACTLSDYYLGIKLPVKADTLLGILDTLERELNNNDAAWIELDKGRGAERRKESERKALDERGIKKDDVLPEGGEEKNR